MDIENPKPKIAPEALPGITAEVREKLGYEPTGSQIRAGYKHEALPELIGNAREAFFRLIEHDGRRDRLFSQFATAQRELNSALDVFFARLGMEAEPLKTDIKVEVPSGKEQETFELLAAVARQSSQMGIPIEAALRQAMELYISRAAIARR